MDFSLSSSLVGSAVSNPDKLALDLQFAADKTLTARKGPTPAFTRGSAGRFVGSDGLIQTAGNGVARFEYDQLTLACKGLLIEESRTNLVLQSEDFSTTWQVNAASIANNVTVAPNGLTTADLLNDIATSAAHQVIQSVGSLTAGQSYTFSVFAKAATHTSFQMTFSTAAFGSGLFANFVLTGSGSIGTSSGVVSKIESYLNGWYRCSITVVAATGGTGGFVQIAANNNNSSAARLVPYLGTNTQVVNLWGSQLEAGLFASSYIPTTSGTAIRSADVCSITGSAFSGMYNQPEGTFVTSSSKTSTNSNAFIGHYSDNSFSNGFDVRYNTSTQVSPLMNVANSNQLTGMQVTITAGSVVNQAFSYKLNDCGYSVNGAETITDTSALIPTATRMAIGHTALASPSLYLNGTISSMRYFKKRLANSKLKALTV